MGSSGTNAAFDAWVSGAFAPELGALGSYVNWGGGHRAGTANNVFRWDVSTRYWSSMGTPSPYDYPSIDSIGALPDGRPAAPHTYQTLAILSSANGGGANGSLISAGLPAVDGNGNGRMQRWWRFNLSTAVWSQFLNSSSIQSGTLTQKCLVQEPNGNMWWFGGGYLSQIYRVTPAGAVTGYGIECNTDATFVGGVVPGSRIIVLHNPLLSSPGPWVFNLANIESGATGATALRKLTYTGTAGPSDGSLEWVPDVGGFANIVSSSPSTIRWLKPSNVNDPWNSSWAWNTETFTGAGGATPQACSNGALGRLKWAASIKCLLWAPNVDDYMQAYRPAGT